MNFLILERAINSMRSATTDVLKSELIAKVGFNFLCSINIWTPIGVGTVAAATLFSQTGTVKGKGRQRHCILIITARAHTQHSAFAASGL